GSRTSRGPRDVGGSSSRRGWSSRFSSSGTSGRVGLSRYPAREPSPVSPQPPYRCRPPSSRRRLSNARPLHQSLRELRAPRERYLRTSGHHVPAAHASHLLRSLSHHDAKVYLSIVGVAHPARNLEFRGSRLGPLHYLPPLN